MEKSEATMLATAGSNAWMWFRGRHTRRFMVPGWQVAMVHVLRCKSRDVSMLRVFFE
jgi:hypothetical protein